MKNFYLILSLTLLIASCGGGGGGGGSSGPASPSYSYTKNIDVTSRGGSWDSNVGVASYRTSYAGYYRSVVVVDMSVNVSTTGVVSIALNRDYSFTPTGGSSPIDMSFDYDITLDPEEDTDWSPGNILDGHMYYIKQFLTQTDMANLESDDVTLKMFDFYADTGPDWLGTDYVTPFLLHMDWGDHCLFCSDNDPNEDFFAGVYGDHTAIGDTPNSGTVVYDVKALAWYRSGISQSDGSWKHRPAIEGNGVFSANFSDMTFSGEFLLDYVFGTSFTGLSYPRAEGASAGSLTFSGDIASSRPWFSGEVAWGANGSGFIEGNFFGPNASEVGGWFDARLGSSYFLLGSFVGCSSGC